MIYEMVRYVSVQIFVKRTLHELNAIRKEFKNNEWNIQDGIEKSAQKKRKYCWPDLPSPAPFALSSVMPDQSLLDCYMTVKSVLLPPKVAPSPRFIYMVTKIGTKKPVTFINMRFEN